MSDHSFRTPTITLGLLAVLVAISPVVTAQSSEEMDTPPPGSIVTDRPTQSASPVLVPPTLFSSRLATSSAATRISMRRSCPISWLGTGSIRQSRFDWSQQV